MNRTVLITGGTGSIGPSIIKLLHENGYRIVVYAKDKFRNNDLPDDIHLYLGDIRRFSFNNIKENIDIVIHMAGITPDDNRYRSSPYEFEEVNVNATKKLVDEAKEHDIARIIFFSSINVYGRNRNEFIDEDCMPNPYDLYGISKLKAEKIILSAKNKKGDAVGTILRIAAVYGPEIKGNYFNLIRLISKNRFVPIGKGMNKRTLIYINDLAKAILNVIENESTIGKIYNVTDGNVYSMKEIINAIYKALDKRPLNIYIPLKLARYSVRFYKQVLTFIRKRPVLSEWQLDKYIENIAVSGQKFIKETGFTPKYGLIDGWKETIRIMRLKRLI